MNYWWHAASDTAVGADSGFDPLVHAMLSLRTLPPATREAWRAMFDHYVFGPQAEVTGTSRRIDRECSVNIRLLMSSACGRISRNACRKESDVGLTRNVGGHHRPQPCHIGSQICA